MPDQVPVTLDATAEQVIYLVSQGLTNEAIARNTNRSIDTVKSLIHRLCLILKARNRAHLVTRGLEAGYLKFARDNSIQLASVAKQSWEAALKELEDARR